MDIQAAMAHRATGSPHATTQETSSGRDYRLMTALMRLKHVKMADRLVVLETVRRLEAGR